MKLDSQKTSGQPVSMRACWCTSCTGCLSGCMGCSHGCVSDACSTACKSGCQGGCQGAKIIY
ncbi:hypothetical protein EXM36_09300 [Clostridium botulinum]|uniref:hypothetical protein n=1 Tax=Clostridium botulinum TaxID=1491 RepID=UPI0013755911|nr:hypothetical protein [Clostridium botulinum]MCC5418040.1 hypothetical protein [Clostridium botulinum]NCI19025.1 hypothetical protein [Clostridium botulinum]NCI38212.1 hypothetical protein [Clostridium botulinum]NCI75048.1 hypothetical protein [Clostridium botulinum]NDI38077.1 hypothetical protein [Clostridium botulinum]